MEYQNLEARVDHRSFIRQGIEQIPTVHMGVSATQMEKRGFATDRGDINREIRQKNNLLQQIINQIRQWGDLLRKTLAQASLENQFGKQEEPDEPEPTSIRERLALIKRQNANRGLGQKSDKSQDNTPAKRIRKDDWER